MESGFSQKSMETEHWAMYIENARGIMIEPSDITSSEISYKNDSVFSDDRRMHFSRDMMYRDLTLYFKQVTFFGEDLLSEKNPFFILVMSREKKTIARIAWNLTGETNRLAAPKKDIIDTIDD